MRSRSGAAGGNASITFAEELLHVASGGRALPSGRDAALPLPRAEISATPAIRDSVSS
jgi:hypothetical protein